MAKIRKGGEISAKESIANPDGTASPYFIRYLLGSQEPTTSTDTSGAAAAPPQPTEATAPVIVPIPTQQKDPIGDFEKRAPFAKENQSTTLYYELAFIDDEGADNSAVLAGTVDIVYFTPFIVYDDFSIADLALRSGLAKATASRKYRMGIYTAASQGSYGCRPLTLIEGSDAGDIGPLVLANTYYSGGSVGFRLDAGVYFLAWVRDSGAVAESGIRAYPITTPETTRAIRQVFTNDETALVNRTIGYQTRVAITFGNLPEFIEPLSLPPDPLTDQIISLPASLIFPNPSFLFNA